MWKDYPDECTDPQYLYSKWLHWEDNLKNQLLKEGREDSQTFEQIVTENDPTQTSDSYDCVKLECYVEEFFV